MILPRKVFLSAVLEIELFDKDIKIEKDTIKYPHKNGFYLEDKTINIYELMNIMKYFLFDKGYLFHINKEKAGTSLPIQWFQEIGGGELNVKGFGMEPTELE